MATVSCGSCRHFYKLREEKPCRQCVHNGNYVDGAVDNHDWAPQCKPKTDAAVSAKVKSDGKSTSYYDLPPGAKDLGDLIEFKDMNFNVGNIFKASYRLGEKEGTDLAYDLNKIIYFAQRELARIK